MSCFRGDSFDSSQHPAPIMHYGPFFMTRAWRAPAAEMQVRLFQLSLKTRSRLLGGVRERGW